MALRAELSAETKGSHVTATLKGILKSTVGKCGVPKMGQSGIFKASFKKFQKNVASGSVHSA